MTICVVAAIAGCGLARAEGANPYSGIAARNAFGLVAPEPVAPAPVPEEPLPKLLPQGMMTIFSRPQFLFKLVLPAAPGVKAREVNCVLAEGEQQEGVEVIRIDVSTGTATVDNHGTLQQISFLK